MVAQTLLANWRHKVPAYLKKTKTEILSKAIEKLQKNTPITAVGPGSIARSITEAITTEIGDLYDILDFNVTQSYLSTASGESLDALGTLYGVSRKEISELATVDRALGSFYFYIQSPIGSDITIPAGTNVYSSAVDYVGRQHSFSTTADAIIPAGRTKVYASLKPNFVDAVYTAGSGTLTFNDASDIAAVTVFSTNPKSISPLPGYEPDEDFRLRIIKQIRVTAAGTVESVRFAALATPNVRDVKIRQAPYGMGSFEVVVVPEQTSNISQTMKNVRTAVDNVKPLGVRTFVTTPTFLPVDVVVNVFIPGASSSSISSSVTRRVEVGVRRYLQGFLPGQSLIYNRLVQVALEANELIRDINISSLTINGSPQLNKNYQSQDDEQLTSGNIVVNIASS